MPLHVPFWFIRDLIVMVTLSPLIWFLMKKAWIIVLPILALAFVSNIWPSVPGMSINAVFFFSLGGWFSINGRDMVNNMVKMKIIGPLLCLIFLMTIIAVPDIKNIVLPWFILAGIISAFGLADSFVNQNHTVKPLLVRSTFFIFAFHVFVLHSINIVLQLFDIVLPQSILSLNIQYVVNTVMAVCLSVVVYAFIEKRMPRVKIILTGK